MRGVELKFSLIIGFLILPAFIFAQVMSSPSYKLRSDSINVGGGYSTSSSYFQESTFGEVGTGISSSSSYILSAGYQALQSTYLSITTSADVTLSPNIGGVSGGTATGQSTWTVVTDDPAGYQLTIAATSTPAMRANTGASVSDYSPPGGVPEFSFAYAATSSVFGFTPEGTDIVQRYRDNSGIAPCNQVSGTDTADKCWDGLSTTPRLIAQSTSSNHPTGTATVVKYEVGIGNSIIQDAGTYHASVVVTATAL